MNKLDIYKKDKIIIQHFVNDEEKSIIENHFIYHKQGSNHKDPNKNLRYKKDSNKNLKEWIDEIILKYEIPQNHLKQISDTHVLELWWDKKTSVLHYLCDHPKFVATNNKIRNLKHLNIDFNQKNEKGETPLMLLVKYAHNYSHIDQFVEKFNMDNTLKNNEGVSFHNYFFNSFNTELFAKSPLNDRHIIQVLHTYESILKDYLETGTFKENLNQVQNVVDKTKGFIQKLQKFQENHLVQSRFSTDPNVIFTLKVIEKYKKQFTNSLTYLELNLYLPEFASKSKKSIKV